MNAARPIEILLVEDNMVNRKFARRLVEKIGFRVDTADNGKEALDALRSEAYDLVLMDIQMPDMHGLEATRCICKRWTKDVRPMIIAMTANAMQGDRETCLEAGMDDYIAKPIRIEELVESLSRVKN